MPYALVGAELTLGIVGIRLHEFGLVQQSAFVKTLVAVLPYFTSDSQVSNVNATVMHAQRRRLSQLPSNRPKVSGIEVHFTVSVSAKVASLLSLQAGGKAYDIQGPAGSSAWATLTDNVDTAKTLVSDMASRLTAATITAPGNKASAWDLKAIAVINAIPLLATGGKPFSLPAAPGAVSFNPNSVHVFVCSAASVLGCISPSPMPTMTHPSQTPTPAPTDVPKYTIGPAVCYHELYVAHK
jgi:hypothetical protein